MSKAVVDLQLMLNRIVASDKHLLTDGDLGPVTKGVIDGLNTPIWVKIGLKKVGVKERAGKDNHPDIIMFHSVSGGFSTDEVPWCGSFVNWCMKEAKFRITVKNPARALSWVNFGTGSAVPYIGAIAVKTRVGGGHVGFVVGVEGKYVYILGGNQSDEANIRKYKISDFSTYQLPIGYVNRQYDNLILPTVSSGGKEA